MYVEKFANGVKTMKHLVKFSLCYDCTNSIVKILIRNCKKTLRILDVEMSKQVTDEAADWIAQAENIHTLQIYHSGMTEVGHAKLLLKLKKLKLLVRGGFLCEALFAGWRVLFRQDQSDADSSWPEAEGFVFNSC